MDKTPEKSLKTLFAKPELDVKNTVIISWQSNMHAVAISHDQLRISQQFFTRKIQADGVPVIDIGFQQIGRKILQFPSDPRRAEVFCPTQHFCGKSILFDFLLIAVVITAAAGIKMQ